jgi:hypothetical protein
MESMSIVCSEKAPQDLKHTEPEQEVQLADAVLSGCVYRTCLVLLRQQGMQQTLTTMIKLGGGQVINHVQYLKTLIICASWPRKARRKPPRMIK